MLKIAVVVLLLTGPPLMSQTVTTVKLRTILVDKDLNQKAVPHLSIIFGLESANPEMPREIKTDFEGNAELTVPPGKYKLTTPQGIDFQGRHFVWEMTIEVGGELMSLELSNDNARVTNLSSIEPNRKVDDLPVMFRKYEKSVVTVWSEIGSGTGFIVDPAGLVMTNQHVVGPSELISVQFDSKRKVAAKVLAFDAERDVAVLYVNPGAFPDALSA